MKPHLADLSQTSKMRRNFYSGMDYSTVKKRRKQWHMICVGYSVFLTWKCNIFSTVYAGFYCYKWGKWQMDGHFIVSVIVFFISCITRQRLETKILFAIIQKFFSTIRQLLNCLFSTQSAILYLYYHMEQVNKHLWLTMEASYLWISVVQNKVHPLSSHQTFLDQPLLQCRSDGDKKCVRLCRMSLQGYKGCFMWLLDH